MDDPDELRIFIRRQIFDGYNKQATFERLYFHFTGYETKDKEALDEKVKKLRKYRLEFKKGNFGYVPNKYHLPFKTIDAEFEKAKRARKARKTGYITFLSPRYAIGANVEHDGRLNGFYLCDIFHGQHRELQVIGEMPENGDVLKIHSLNLNHFFIFKRRYHPNYREIADLIRVDYDRCEFTVQDKWIIPETDGDCNFPFPFYSAKFLVDFFDPNRFAFCYEEGLRIYTGQFKDGKLEVEKAKCADRELFEQIFGEDANLLEESCKLEGNEIYALGKVGHKKEKKYFFAKLNLSPGHIQPELLFYIDTEFKLGRSQPANWDASGRNWYVFKRDRVNIWYEEESDDYHLDNKTYETRQLYKFDLDARKVTKLNFHLDRYKTQHLDSFHLIIDGDVVQMYASNRTTYQLINWRHSLTDPAKLQNLAMSAVQRELMFMSKNEYETLVNRLPQSLKPFGGRVPKIQCGESSTSEYGPGTSKAIEVDQPGSSRATEVDHQKTVAFNDLPGTSSDGSPKVKYPKLG